MDHRFVDFVGIQAANVVGLEDGGIEFVLRHRSSTLLPLENAVYAG